MNKNFVIVLGCLFSGLSISSFAAEKITRCDRLTANKLDPHRVADPIAFDKIDAPTAISICHAELRSDPDNSRLMLNLGRAYNKLEVYAESFNWTKKAAMAGYPYANHVMALHYLYGEGVAKDVKEEARWYYKAANHGVAAAQYSLGNMFSIGKGVPKDAAKAVMLYRVASQQGFVAAQIEFGIALIRGQHVPRDKIAGISLVYRAARGGNATAMFKMAESFATGYGVKHDNFSALVWAYYAQDAGAARSKKLIEFLKTKLPVDDIVEARRRRQKQICSRASKVGMWLCSQSDYNPNIQDLYINYHYATIDVILREYFE